MCGVKEIKREGIKQYLNYGIKTVTTPMYQNIPLKFSMLIEESQLTDVFNHYIPLFL